MTFFGVTSSFWDLITMAVSATFVGVVVSQVAQTIVNQKYQPGDLYPLHWIRKRKLVSDWTLLSASLTVIIPVAYELWASYGIASFKSYIALVVILVGAAGAIWYTILGIRECIEDLRRSDAYWKHLSRNSLHSIDPKT